MRLPDGIFNGSYCSDICCREDNDTRWTPPPPGYQRKPAPPHTPKPLPRLPKEQKWGLVPPYRTAFPAYDENLGLRISKTTVELLASFGDTHAEYVLHRADLKAYIDQQAGRPSYEDAFYFSNPFLTLYEGYHLLPSYGWVTE